MNLERMVRNVTGKGASLRVIIGILNVGLKNAKTRKALLGAIEKGQMPEYNRNYRRLTDPLWEEQYIGRNRIEVA